MAIYKNITGVIKFLKSEGYGFITPDTTVGIHDKDILFHRESILNKDLNWTDIKDGQKVNIMEVTSVKGNLEASGVTISNNQQNDEGWLKEIIDTIGISRYERLEEHIYTTRYKKIIADLKNEHHLEVRNIVLVFLLFFIALLFYNYSKPVANYPLERDGPQKTDYNPYWGSVYE